MVYNKIQTDQNMLSNEKKYYRKIKLQKEKESAGGNGKIKTPPISRYLLVSETY